MDKTLMVGTGAADITPEIGGQLFGYRPDIYSKSMNDPLSVTAIAVSDGAADVMLIAVSVCLIGTALSEKIRALVAEQAELPFENILLSATHTHSGPNTCGMVGWGEIDHAYCDSILIPKIVEAAVNAKQSKRPALAGNGAVWSRAGVNRRRCKQNGNAELSQESWAAFDGNMTLVAFQEPGGKPIATIVHYGMHGTCAGLEPVITRDWVGVMSDRLAQKTGAPVLFLNGAEGDVGPRLSNGVTTGDLSYIYEIGGIAAVDAVNAYAKIKNYQPHALRVVTGELELELTDRIPLETARANLKAVERESINLDGRKAQYYRDVIASYETDAPREDCLKLPQTMIALGGVVFVPFPFEVFSEISLRLREYSRFEHTLCVGLTNGHKGYLPSQTQLCRGGYEIDSFKTESIWPFADDTDTRIINENLKLMEALSCIDSDKKK